MEFRMNGFLRWALSLTLFFSVLSFSGCNSRTSYHQQTAKREAINYKDFSGTRKLFYKRSLADLLRAEKRPGELKLARAGAVVAFNSVSHIMYREASFNVAPLQPQQAFSPVKTIPQASDEPSSSARA